MRKIRKDKVTIEPGTKFNQLEFLEDLGLVGRNRVARFKCDCGLICEKVLVNVVRGKTQTCGHLLDSISTRTREKAIKYLEDTKDGFFNYDLYVKSDFILQS